MKQSLQRYAGFFSISLLACASFVACGGLDGRNVTRGPDEPIGGDTASAGQGTGNSSAGGSESNGGEPGNPFGGNLGEGGVPVVDGPPEVVNVDPRDKAKDAQPTDAVSLLFSEGLDAATVVSDNIKIMDGTTEVEGELSYEGVIATFAPSHRLSLLASYDVSVSQGITDAAGQALKAPFASKFTVRDGAWSKQTQAFDDQDMWAGDHDSATDAQGNTLVVWSRRDENGVVNLFARWYRATTGWQAEVPLEDLTDTCFYPRVAVSPEGDAVVAWFKSDADGNVRTLARRFVNGTWEPTALDVAPMGTDVFNTYSDGPAVAIGGGQVVVSWISIQYVPSPFRQDYTLYQTASPLEGAWPDYATGVFGAYYTFAHQEDVRKPRLTVDAKGNAISVFGYNSVTATDVGVYYSRKAATGSWQYAIKLPGSSLPDSGPFVVSDGDGAMAVWSTYDTMTTKYSVLASRYTKAKQFASPVLISDPDLKDYLIMSTGRNLASNGKNFFASWSQSVGASRNVYATRYDIATSKWDALPTVVSDGEAITGGDASIGVDGHGNALVAFDQEGAQNGYLLMFARFTATTGTWAAPALLAEDSHNYSNPILNVADNGVGSVLFRGGGREGPGAGPVVGGQFKIFR
jgi:hypothetical protein